MPKVEFSREKGLIQKGAASGDSDLFVVKGAAIQPSVIESQRQLVTVADLGKTGAQINGLYFEVYDSSQRNVVWFTSTDNADPASQPSLGIARYIKVAVVDADTDIQVAAKAETAIELNSELEVNDTAADGSFFIEGATPYLAAGTANAGTLGTAVTQTLTGKGTLKSFALEPHGVSVLNLASLGDFEAQPAFTLGAGPHIGCMKTIIRSDTDNENQTLTLTGYLANDTTRAGRTFTFSADDDATAKTLILNWDGSGWAIVKMSAGITVA